MSPHSSVPSTAVSSPHLRPTSSAHSQPGGLDVPAMSILRRDSVSSDGEALGQMPQMQAADARPDVSVSLFRSRLSVERWRVGDRADGRL